MKTAHPLCAWLLCAGLFMIGCGGDSPATTSGTTGGGGSGTGGTGGQGGAACVPETETCDGADNDCDGAADEGCDCVDGQAQACYTGPMPTRSVGACQDGTQTCAGGAWGPCQGDVLPAEEVCDNLDNNCDGAVDEDLGTTACGVGACAVDAPNCLNGQPNACVPGQPTAETCDGVDNNCDGTADDGDPEGGQPCDTGMPGVCAAGTSACVNGAVACNQDEPATAELCDGLDNDCNGMTDDGAVPGAGQPCDTGMPGACAAGMTACTGGSITCVATTQPAPEVCGNAADDDCDGAIDEGLEPTGWEVRVTNSATASSPLQVLWTGTEYAVLYHEIAGSPSNPVIHLQRVDASGALVGPPSVLTPAPATSYHGRIAWNGTEYGFVYWTYETWPDDATRFQRVASDGTLIGSPVDIDPNASSQPDIVWNGTDYAVTWMSRVTSQMLFRRISSTGSFLTSSAALGSAHSIGEIAWTGSQYGVTWDLYDYGASNNTGYFTRVNAAGAEVGSEIVVTPTPVPPVGCCGIAGLFDVAWNGSAFGVLRRGLADRPTFIPVSSTGVLGASSVVIDEQGMYPELLWNGSEHLATFWWNTRLTFARLSPAGALLGKHTIQSGTHPNVGQGRIAWDGASLVAAWKDARHGNDEVSLARYAPACQ